LPELRNAFGWRRRLENANPLSKFASVHEREEQLTSDADSTLMHFAHKKNYEEARLVARE
jgi:hypothetical protein